MQNLFKPETFFLTVPAFGISDFLKLRWTDVYDEDSRQFHTHITVIEHKTKKRKTIALNKCAIDALRLYFPHRKSEWVFVSRNGGKTPITRQQAWRIMRDACTTFGIDEKIACHGIRKTWGVPRLDESISFARGNYGHL